MPTEEKLLGAQLQPSDNSSRHILGGWLNQIQGAVFLFTYCFWVVGMNVSQICSSGWPSNVQAAWPKCPESTSIPVGSETLPIHHLLSHCQHRQVKEVIVSLLREYPESYNMATSRNPIPAPSSVPFIQRIKPLLEKRGNLKRTLLTYGRCQECSKMQWMVLKIQVYWLVQLVTRLSTGPLSPPHNVWKLGWNRSLNCKMSAMQIERWRRIFVWICMCVWSVNWWLE